MRKIIVIMTLCLAVLMTSNALHAASFDPSENWKMIRTKHFKVNFPERIETLGVRAAEILEDIYPLVTEKWSWKPWKETEVVLVDNTDSADGLATVLPYNYIIIYVAPPDSNSSLSHYDDWLRTVLVHEFTHVVQIDAYGGVWYPFRVVLGKMISPSGIDPTWIKEGMSQYGETIFTGGGRGRGSFSEMAVRTAVIEDAFPPIDVADGLSYKWPGGKTAYIFGLKFIQWLIDTYGEDKFLEFDKRVRKSILMAMINHQAKHVYKKTFYQLWREWKKQLAVEYDELKTKIEAEGLTPFEEIVVNTRDEQYISPQVSPDGKRIVYSVTSPHHAAEIRILDLESKKTKVIVKRKVGSQFTWSPDGTKIIYSAMGVCKNKYNNYYDLWEYDSNKKGKKKLSQLTHCARARDADFLPDGKSIIFVSNNITNDTIKRYDLESKKIEEVTAEVDKFTQFSNPRVSPDGKYIAVSVLKSGEGWRIYRMDLNGKNFLRMTKGSGIVIENRPAWTPGSKQIVFSSDETGIANLYSADLNGRSVKKITNVLTGTFAPSVDSNSNVYALRYHSKGYEVVRYSLNLLPQGEGRPARQTSAGGAGGDEGGRYRLPSPRPSPSGRGYEGEDNSFVVTPSSLKPEKYVAFGKSLFLPRYIIPNVAYADDAFFANAYIGGMDPLGWHKWTAAGTYRSDANYFGYRFDYLYNRFKPRLGFGFGDYPVKFGRFLNQTTGRTFTYYEHRTGFYTYLGYPIDNHMLGAAYFYERRSPAVFLTPEEEQSFQLGPFAGFRVSYNYGDSEKYAASISNENGRTIKLFSSVTAKYFGSGDRNEQVIFSGDWREYIRLYRHHVLALRAGGGMTWWDEPFQGTFGMGGATGEGAFASPSSFTYFPLRGIPISGLVGTRAMLLSGEYRFPIYAVQRGIGTWPVFLKDISGAAFSDCGNIWNANSTNESNFSTFFNNFLVSIGGELRGDFYIGHGLPVHGRIGYAYLVKNRNRFATYNDPIFGQDLKYGMFLLVLGTAF